MDKRRGPRLNPGDLKKFGRKFCADISAFMPGRALRLAPLSEFIGGEAPRADDLVIPLKHKGRDLGYLIVSGDGRVWPREMDEFLPEITRQGLETMWLRKALLTDRETGLFSRDYFRRRLAKALRRHRRDGAAKSLSMDSQAAPELLVMLAELREAADPPQALADFAARLSERLPARCVSRAGARRLAFLVEGRPEEARLNLESALADQQDAAPESRPVAAWVRYPGDFGDPGPNFVREAEGSASDEAALLLEKAGAALFQARQSRDSAALVAFDDLLEHHGQVVQLLPLDRVVINLGRVAGAAPGQVFLVNVPGETGGESDYKGEATIFETADGYSLG
ncbi:MAG: hypothetical protein LBV79_01380, partial [Candidatus Adiutrix sp.]|nr:hypothetical protein [Candidatus Adiutrix sp.]